MTLSAAELRALREALDVRGRRLSRELGEPANWICEFESGRLGWTQERAARIAGALRIIQQRRNRLLSRALGGSRRASKSERSVRTNCPKSGCVAGEGGRL